MNHDVNLKLATAKDLAILFEEHGPGITEEEMRCENEPLRKIEVAPSAFQFRDLTHRPWAKNHHVRKLVQALKRQDEPFDPLLLFAIAGHRLVLDGHCRLAAYRKTGADEDSLIPVRYFRGNFSEALTRPASENSKAKLELTPGERLEAAWTLVLFDEERENYSLRQIGNATGVGKSTVGGMRNLLEATEAVGFDPRDETWKEVKRMRRDERNHDPEWADKRAKAWAGKLRRQLGDKPNETPECFFEALEIGYPQLFPQGVPSHWRDGPGMRNELRTEEEDYEF